MRTQLTKIALAATLGLALALTFSCHDGGSDDTGTSSPGGIGGSSPSDSSSSSIGGIGNSSPSGGSSSSANTFVGEKGTFKDNRDGQTYNWVKIGTQIWMAQNLNYHEEWVGPTRGNKCYNNRDANCEKYGRLYEWYDAIRLCPDGWHLPSRAEWNDLISFVGTDAGKKLKSTSSDWRDGAGTDDYSFEALPGGRITDEFSNINVNGFWWTISEHITLGDPYAVVMEGLNVGIYYEYYGYHRKTYQYSVRCIEGYSSSSSIAYGEVTDERDSQKYVTVKIGEQTWMAQNLNYAGASPQKGLCYNNKPENCDKYGRLYDWATAMGISANYNTERLNASPGLIQGICMDGWHLPSNSEWDALISFTGGYSGEKLAARSSEWGDNYGPDIYGFGALPGGSLYQGEFVNLNKEGSWWTSLENDYNKAYRRWFGTGRIQTWWDRNDYKTDQNSVRCVED
jgi:uncharacterized protein (TIGR02145 family)